MKTGLPTLPIILQVERTDPIISPYPLLPWTDGCAPRNLTCTRVTMNIEQLAADLPNGFHDALLRTFSSDPEKRSAEFVLDIWVGDLYSPIESERERKRPALLELLGVAYLVAEEPAPGRLETTGLPVQIDACGPDDNSEMAHQVPTGGFAGRFFVTEWNAFIHFAARDARLSWLEVN
jgi:hypothetical protein